MKVEVVKEFSFDAAHFIPDYDGKCQRIHGHRWVLQIGVKGEVNEKTGMVLDFKEIEEVVQSEIVDELDHRLLNDVNFSNGSRWFRFRFPCHNPTAENMVMWAVKTLRPSFQSAGVTLTLVRLYESPGSYAEWRSHEEC